MIEELTPVFGVVGALVLIAWAELRLRPLVVESLEDQRDALGWLLLLGRKAGISMKEARAAGVESARARKAARRARKEAA